MPGCASAMSARYACGRARWQPAISPPRRSPTGRLSGSPAVSRSPPTATRTRTLAPIRVELDLAAGNTVAADVADVLGSPARPLLPEAARAKFAMCCAELPDRGTTLWETAMTLETVGDVSALTDVLTSATQITTLSG